MKSVAVKHSGGVGDIIYALPALLSIVMLRRIEHVTFYMHLNQKVRYSGPHPLGTVLLNESYVKKLAPLLLAQKFIREVEIYQGQAVDVDFDILRRARINYSMYSIPRWYFLTLVGSSWDLTKPWLTVEPDWRFKDFALVGRNARLQSPFIKYDFLDSHADQIVFVGVQSEFDEFQKRCPRCTRFYEAPDFLELARVLAGCGFYAGNQGFIYTLAEALKIPRLLETNNRAANNIPEGGACFDALFQPGFEYWFNEMIRRFCCH